MLLVSIIPVSSVVEGVVTTTGPDRMTGAATVKALLVEAI
jgi:hypothetical protein